MSEDNRQAQFARLAQQFDEKVGGPAPNALIDAITKVAMGEAWCHFANSLLHDGSLSARERELAILRIASRRGAAYVIDGHRRIATRDQALDHAELDRIANVDLSAWSPREQLLIRAADAIDAGSLPETLRASLWRELGEELLIEFGLVIGQYILVSTVTTLLGLEPEQAAA